MATNPDFFDCIVVGGGVSGLTLASRRARDGGRVCLLEAETRLGGCIESWRPFDAVGPSQGGDCSPSGGGERSEQGGCAFSGFAVELGAHTAYNSYGALLTELEARAGLTGLLPREKAGYYFFDHGHTVSPLRRLSFASLLLHLPFGLLKDKAHASVGDYYRGLFGARNYQRLLAPAFAAVLSQPAEDYPAAWLFRKKPRLKTAPRKYSHTGGLQGLTEALATGLDIRTGISVSAIARMPEGFVLHTAQGELRCRQLALATPADVTARLLREIAPDLAQPLADIEMAEIETLAVVVKRDAVRLPHLAGLIGDTAAWFSAVSRDPIPHPDLRAFTFHFRPGRLDAAQRRAAVAQVLGVEGGSGKGEGGRGKGRGDLWSPAGGPFLAVTEKTNRLPRLTPAHVALAAQIDAQTCNQPLALVGNYLNGLSLGDCAERARREGERLGALS